VCCVCVCVLVRESLRENECLFVFELCVNVCVVFVVCIACVHLFSVCVVSVV